MIGRKVGKLLEGLLGLIAGWADRHRENRSKVRKPSKKTAQDNESEKLLKWPNFGGFSKFPPSKNLGEALHLSAQVHWMFDSLVRRQPNFIVPSRGVFILGRRQYHLCIFL